MSPELSAVETGPSFPSFWPSLAAASAQLFQRRPDRVGGRAVGAMRSPAARLPYSLERGRDFGSPVGRNGGLR